VEPAVVLGHPTGSDADWVAAGSSMVEATRAKLTTAHAAAVGFGADCQLRTVGAAATRLRVLDPLVPGR
jgi:hypothetical protein